MLCLCLPVHVELKPLAVESLPNQQALKQQIEDQKPIVSVRSCQLLAAQLVALNSVDCSRPLSSLMQ